jgi:glycosyltransferase involved in cell wall biosynthesis
MPLRIAAKMPRAERGYFNERVKPMIDGEQIRLVGEVTDRAKAGFLAHAAALLFPIDWPEPFGLVMIEAMACGTPVIAFRRGSVPEVIEDGVTGFIVDDEAEALRAIKRLAELDRRSVRYGFERRFTARRMAEDYVRHYQLLSQDRPGQLRDEHPHEASGVEAALGLDAAESPPPHRRAIMRPSMFAASPDRERK